MRKGRKVKRRAGIKTQVAHAMVNNKRISTIKKYRNGYNTAWKFRACRAYMKRHGFLAPGEWDPENQLGGQLFATPNECKFIRDEWCGNIMWIAYKKHKATKSQLKAISKTLSFAYQLKHGAKGNWSSVTARWKNDFCPDKMGPPTQQVKARICLPAKSAKHAFTTSWNKATGWFYPRWCAGYLGGWDWIMIGSRSKEDLTRIKYSRLHEMSKACGWLWTEFLGGRAKCEAMMGVRPWKAWRTCMCIGGEHRGLPDDYKECRRLFGKDGNPKEEPTWTTECPLTCFEVIRHWLKRSHVETDRVYPKWNPRTCKFGAEDFGKKLLLKEIQAWISIQGANPDGLQLDTNSGRKTLGYICDECGVPENESFEWHADQHKNWAPHYQPNCKRVPSHTRRDQSDVADICIAGHVRIRNAWGRGKPEPPPAPPPPPPAPQGLSAELLQMKDMLALNIRLMGGNAELNQILKGGTP